MGQDATVDGITKNGVIHTGYFNNWHQMYKEDKDKVIAERARTGTAIPGKGPKGRKVSATNTNKQKHDMAKTKKELDQATRHIDEINSVRKDKDKDDDKNPADDAGDSFGGRNSRRQKREKRLLGYPYFCWVITVVRLIFNSKLCYLKQAH